jgi:hypothetical protein
MHPRAPRNWLFPPIPDGRSGASRQPAAELSIARSLYYGFIVRPIMFAVPVAIVQQWCDLHFSWKLWMFVMFCLIWSDSVDRIGKEDQSLSTPTARGSA